MTLMILLQVERVVIPVNADGSRVKAEAVPIGSAAQQQNASPASTTTGLPSSSYPPLYQNPNHAHSSPAISMPSSTMTNNYIDASASARQYPEHRAPGLEGRSLFDGSQGNFGISITTVSFEGPSMNDQAASIEMSSAPGRKKAAASITPPNGDMHISMLSTSPKSNDRMSGSPAEGLFLLNGQRTDLLTPTALYMDDPIELDSQANTSPSVRAPNTGSAADLGNVGTPSSIWNKSSSDKYSSIRNTWVKTDTAVTPHSAMNSGRLDALIEGNSGEHASPKPNVLSVDSGNNNSSVDKNTCIIS
jgi:hypothetical protein